MSRIPNLFRDGRTTRVLRWLVEVGSASTHAFKARHVSLGGTENSTHVFDRYMVGRRSSSRFNTYVPKWGSYGIIERENSALFRKAWSVRWVGSDGETFDERAANWLDRLSPQALGDALVACERDLLDTVARGEDDRSSALWLIAVSAACRRADAAIGGRS